MTDNHVHTYHDLKGIQRVTGRASDCETCPQTAKHYSADNRPVIVGARFWTNDLRVAQITELGTRAQAYSDTGEFATWHKHTDGISDTLTGRMRQYGRLARFFEGKDAEKYPNGTNYADVKSSDR